MSIREIAVKAAKNTAAAAYMPIKAGVDTAKGIGHQIIDPYAPSNIMRQFKYHSGLAIVEKLFSQSKDSLFGKDKKATDKTNEEKKEKTDESVLFEVRNTNSILAKVTAILEATHELTRSIFGLELKAANENKNKSFDNLEKYREGKNFNVGMMGIGGAANAANGNTPSVNPQQGGGIAGDIATGIGAGIGGRIAVGAIAGTIGAAIMGSLRKIFNIKGLISAFTKTGLIGRIMGMIGGGLMAGVASIFSLGKLLPLLTKLAWPATIVASIGMGIMDGWNKYMETGDLAASIQTGLTSSLDFLTFGLFSAIKDAAGSWLTGGNIVNPDESNAKVDLARDQLIKGEITQEQYDAALATHEEELKKYEEFMSPVNNDIAREALGMPDLMTPPIIDDLGSGNVFSPEPQIFDPMGGVPWGVTPNGSNAGTGDKPPLKIIIDGSEENDPWSVEQGGKVLFESPGLNPLYKDDVTAPPSVLPPTPSTSTPPVIVNNSSTVNNSSGGGAQPYRHSPISTTPNHQGKWERNWLTSD